MLENKSLIYEEKELAEELKCGVSTIRQYLANYQLSHVIVMIIPYNKNPKNKKAHLKRIIKISPKDYLLLKKLINSRKRKVGRLNKIPNNS